MNKKLPVTVVMITLNEELNLPGALKNVQDWAEEIYIVDSLSTDRTVDIALEYGAHVVQRKFTNFGDHWNWTLSRLPIVTPWIFPLAPDERLSSALIEEMRALLEGNPTHDGYTVRRRLWFLGTPLRGATMDLRLVRNGKARITPVLVNEHLVVDGKTGTMKGHIEHLDSPNLYHWFEKQNRYSTIRAIEMVTEMADAATPRLFGSRLERRMFFKRLFFRIPGRYILYWLYLALGKGEILSGYAGRAWIRFRLDVLKWAEYKAYEFRKTGIVPSPPIAAHGDFDPRVLRSELQRKISA